MRVHINNFTGGEMAPYLEGRTDLPNLARGCRLLRNFLPRSTGGIFRRPGFLYQWSAYYADRVCCLLPFNFSDSDSFVLEFGHEYLRFGKDGALVISGIHPYRLDAEWQEEDLFQIKFVQINDILWGAHPARSPFQLSRIADNDWTLRPIQTLIKEGASGDNNAWPPMLDENVTQTTLSCDHTAVGTGVLTASSALFDASHVGSFWEISHRRETAYSELLIPVFPAASSTMDFRVLPIEGQQFTTGGSIYTWKATANVSAAYQIDIGTTTEEARDNAVAAINGTGGGPGTALNPSVTASAVSITATSQAATGVLTGNGANNLTSNARGYSPVRVTIGPIIYTYLLNPVDSLFGATYNVRQGATEKESLSNLVKAINATGVNNVDYYGPSGVTAHPDVTAALTADNQVTVTARTGGDAGNSIAISVNNSSAATEPLAWSGATLSSGGGTATYRMKVTSREVGSGGNDITIGGMYFGVLSSSDAGVTNVSNNNTITVNGRVYTFKTILTGVADEIFIGAGWDASLLNFIRAINLTGTIGTDYGTGTTINADVFAGATVTSDHKVILVSKTINPATITTTESAATLSFGAASLQSPWNSTTLTGGADIDLASTGFEVLGSYKIFSYGTWKGTVILERRVTLEGVSPEVWEPVRQWRGNNDRNVVESGEALSPEFLRLRIIDGAGTSSADVDIPRFVIEANDVRIYGLVEITTVNSDTSAQVNIIRALFSTEAVTTWSEGAWSDYRGWPNAVAVHEQRLLFGGTTNEPERVWASATSDFLNFRRSTADGGSWVRTLAADESSRIVWGTSLGGSLVIGKPEEDWLMSSGSGDAAITPSNANAREQSQYGSADIQPLKIASRLVFVQEGGRNLLEYAFSWENQNFNAADLSELFQHLTREGIKQLDWAKRPHELICVVTSDNKFFTITYKRKEEGSVIAAALHPTDGEIESCCVINGADSKDDIYVAVKRNIDGNTYRYIERMDNRSDLALERADALYKEWLETDANWADYMAERNLLTFLDSSIRVTVGSPTTSFSGFGHLEGETVTVVADGSAHPDVRVSGGVITLNREASVVLAGLPYTSQVQSMPFDLQGGDGTSQGKKFKVSDVTIRFYLSSSGKYSDSPSGATKWDIILRDASDDANAPVPLVSGIRPYTVTGNYNDSITVWCGTSDAMPMNILSVIPNFTIHST